METQIEYLDTTGATWHNRPATNPRAGMTTNGYTTRRGAPTDFMVTLAGEARPRRVYVWCFSNAGTCFVRIKGSPRIVADSAIPSPQEIRDAGAS